MAAPPLDSPRDGPVTYPGDIKTCIKSSKERNRPTLNILFLIITKYFNFPTFSTLMQLAITAQNHCSQLLLQPFHTTHLMHTEANIQVRSLRRSRLLLLFVTFPRPRPANVGPVINVKLQINLALINLMTTQHVQ